MTSTHPERLETAPGLARRLLALVVGFVLALLGLASTTGPVGAQNAVGPHHQNLILHVRVEDSAAQTSVGVRGPPGLRHVSATGVAPTSGGGLYRSNVPIEGTSGGAVTPSMGAVNNVAGTAGVDLGGIKVSIDTDPALAGRQLYGHTPDIGNITLYPDAFTNEGTLAATLGHERNHIFQLGLYGPPTETAMSAAFENGSYAVEPGYLDYFRTFGQVG